MIRNRGLGRLWIDGKVVIQTTVRTSTSDGHEEVKDLAEPPLPGHRVLQPGDKETIATVKFETAGEHKVVLESMVGGANARAEPGEMLVGYWQDRNERIRLLQAGKSNVSDITMTDEALARLHQATEHR